MAHLVDRCSFCGGESRFVVSETLRVCEHCALRVADLTILPSEKIWATDPVRQLRPPIEPEPDFEKLKEDLARSIAIDDADTHCALAQAYKEMGLYRDATQEAGQAIRARGRPVTTTDALRLLLREPLLEPRALKRLRERLRQPLH